MYSHSVKVFSLYRKAEHERRMRETRLAVISPRALCPCAARTGRRSLALQNHSRQEKVRNGLRSADITKAAVYVAEASQCPVLIALRMERIEILSSA